MNNNGTVFLKVMSIIMIVVSALGFIGGVLAFFAVSALAVLGAGSGILYLSAVLIIVSAVIYLVAGIKGLKACNDISHIGSCIKLGIVGILLAVLGNVISGVYSSGIDMKSIIISIVIPVLYLIAASKLKNG